MFTSVHLDLQSGDVLFIRVNDESDIQLGI